MARLHIPISFFLPLLIFSLSKTNLSLSIANPSVISLTNNQTDIHEVIPSYGLPKGLIPDNVKSYKLRDSGSFVIRLNSPCYVQFDRLVYYGTDIRGKLSYGSVREVSGIEAKKGFFWFSVTAIQANENDGTIKFSVGPFSETFPATRFAEVPTCESRFSLKSHFKPNGAHTC